MNKRRIVVTGLGTVSSIGIGVDTFWSNLIAGQSGIRSMKDIYDATKDQPYHEFFKFLENADKKFRASCLGLVTDLDIFTSSTDHLAKFYGYQSKINISPLEWRKIGLYSKFAVSASLEALLDSGILNSNGSINANTYRAGIIMGNGIGGLDIINNTYDAYKEYSMVNEISNAQSLSKWGATHVISTISNLCASYISIGFGLKGLNYVTNAACAASNLSISNAAEYIRSGRADVMVCGGSERSSAVSGIGGFDAMTALSRWTGDPSEASKPYHKDRDGFVFADGAGVLILEELEHAKARQARAIETGAPVPKIYCEYLDYGASSDAGHISRPDPDGVKRAMRDALQYSGVNTRDITHVTTHGTSTPAGDQCELSCIEEVLNAYENNNAKTNGDNISTKPFDNCVISAIKSSIGHTLGAAAGVQNVALAKALSERIAPPILNLTPENSINPNAKYSLVGKPETQVIKPGVAMSNSFGFGGVNTVTMWKTYTP